MPMPTKGSRKERMAANIAKHGDLTLDVLVSYLSYDLRTGVFRWMVKRPKGVKPNDIAGRKLKNGSVSIQLLHRQYQAHRLAWLYHYGKWPTEFLDHINGNPADNRICNLREATNSQNQANRKRLTTNTSGFRGVTWNQKCQRWQASIKKDGKNIYLGLYEDAEKAGSAYKAAAAELFGEFAA